MPTAWAKILNGVVVNVQMCEATDIFDPAFVWVDLGENLATVGIGWTYDGTNFSPPGN